MPEAWTRTWSIDDVPNILSKASIFLALPFARRIQVGAAVVSHDAPHQIHEIIPKGFIEARHDETRWMYRFYVQSNPKGRWEFDSFKFAVETDAYPLSLQDVLLAIERTAHVMYGKYASDGLRVCTWTGGENPRSCYMVHDHTAFPEMKKLKGTE